tara:strand:- start:4927 stop:5586 length:660 start_codon:yes stop_codon:yes gene_type:complete
MANQLNSGTITSLKTGQTLLTKVTKTNTNKIQVEFVERISNPNATASGVSDGFSNALGALNFGDDRFAQTGGVRYHWASIEPEALEIMLEVSGLDLVGGEYTFETVNGKQKEAMYLNIANPTCVVDPSSGDTTAKRFRIRIVETTDGTDFDVENGRYKTKGKGGDAVLHNGNYIYNRNQILFAENLSDDVKVPHVFLASDTVSVTSKVEAMDEVSMDMM